MSQKKHESRCSSSWAPEAQGEPGSRQGNALIPRHGARILLLERDTKEATRG